MTDLTPNFALPLLLGFALVALINSLNIKLFRLGYLPAILASATLFASLGFGGMTAPNALSAPESTGKPAPEQELQATQSSSQYIGLEYVQGSALEEAKGDQEIIETIEEMNDNLVVQSSNGSVFLSGTVNDRQTARSLVNDTKQIPGVIQVSYELGLQQES